MELINLAMVYEHTIFRKVLKEYFSAVNINMAIQTANIRELFEGLKKTPIDILLLDTLVIQLNGKEIIRAIKDSYPDMKILVLSLGADMQIIVELLDFGIHGCISRDDEPEDLVKAILSVASNKIYRNKLFTEALYYNKENVLNSVVSDKNNPLDSREKQVLQFLWEEKSNREIAETLFLSVRSIEKIRQDMKEKLRVRSTIGLLKYGIDKRIIQTEVKNTYVNTL
ncbi:MAG: response regulator transcription factor [Chitinophaga sp.]|uniref:response regulator n=1 Tax=Chitinophaga sp. TaxID=1869181 RepID=UPI001B068396|nr:response regulator transcription factor [Chitinophaga sp.]MBO9730356.1 response regulator transcription factor [Chitinophaga sp.]